MPDEIQEAFMRMATSLAEEDDPKELAQTLYSLQKLRSQLSGLIDEAHRLLAGMMKKVEVDLGEGIGVIRRSRDVKTVWNHEEMLRLVMDQHRKIDPDSGEVEIDGFALASSIRELVAFSYWRKTKLREAKIDFNEAMTETYGQPRIRFLSKEGS